MTLFALDRPITNGAFLNGTIMVPVLAVHVVSFSIIVREKLTSSQSLPEHVTQ